MECECRSIIRNHLNQYQKLSTDNCLVSCIRTPDVALGELGDRYHTVFKCVHCRQQHEIVLHDDIDSMYFTCKRVKPVKHLNCGHYRDLWSHIDRIFIPLHTINSVAMDRLNASE